MFSASLKRDLHVGYVCPEKSIAVISITVHLLPHLF